MTLKTETDLLRAARNLNKEALTEIFDCYSVELYNYALRIYRNPLVADKVVGEVFAKFLDQLAAGNGHDNHLRSCLYRITYHLMADEMQFSNQSKTFESLEHVEGDGHKSAMGLKYKILLDALPLTAKNDLTEEQRHVIILRFLEGFSLHETADIIGKDVNHVKALQNQGITNLRKIFWIEG